MENTGSAHAPQAPAFRLDDLRVEPASGRVTGPGGEVQLEPRVMAVLLALAQTPGQPVSRAKLLADIWPGGQVYDEALTQCIYQLRQQLVQAGGGEHQRKLVRTLPKRGYQLDASVTPDEPAGGGPAGSSAEQHATHPGLSRRWVFALLAVLVIVAAAGFRLFGKPGSTVAIDDELTVAVLPFLNATGDAQRDFLSEGISDSLRERVTAMPGLRVASRRSSGNLGESTGDPLEIGRLLRVHHLVEGRYDSERGVTRVSVELVDARTGFVSWTKQFERPDRQLLLLEQEMALDLLGQLLPGQELPVYPKPSNPQVANHELIHLARWHAQHVTDFQSVDGVRLSRAVELYRQVLDQDPDSVEAHARLGRLLLYAGDIVAAAPHVLRTMELDPGLADAYTSLGLYLWLNREEGVGEAWQRAVELNPSDPEALAYLASWTWMQGRTAAATGLYRDALAVDPRSLVRYADLGFRLAMSGDRAQVEALVAEILRLFPERAGYLAAAQIHQTLGDLDVAIALALKARLPDGPDAETDPLLGAALARLGADDAALRFEPEPGIGTLYWQRRYADLIELGEDILFDQPDNRDLQFMIAFASAALGDYEQAIAGYEAAGLPGIAVAESRRATEIQALLAHGCVLWAAGREEEARQNLGAVRTVSLAWYESDRANNWLARTAEAMHQVVFGDPERARSLLESLVDVETLPWLPWLRDSACFSGWAGEPWFDDTVRAVQSRTDAQLKRLEGTLARFGVAWPDGYFPGSAADGAVE